MKLIRFLKTLLFGTVKMFLVATLFVGILWVIGAVALACGMSASEKFLNSQEATAGATLVSLTGMASVICLFLFQMCREVRDLWRKS